MIMRVILPAAFAALLLLAACSQTPRQGAGTATPANPGQPRAQQAAPEPRQNLADPSITSHLESLATRVPGVQSARCVVMGHTAIVGINVRPELDRARVDTIKYSVAEAMRKDPYGANAIVTADMDLSQRITEMGNQIRAGQPVAAFTNELGDIIGRILPQFPKDVRPRNSVPPRSENPNPNNQR
jgi:YhcN/YlaJ family sporulation lipoprotein